METVIFEKLNNKIKNYFTALDTLSSSEVEKANHFINNGAKAAEALDRNFYEKIIKPVESILVNIQKEVEKTNFKFSIAPTLKKINLIINGSSHEYPLASLNELCTVLSINDNTPYYYILISYILYPENYNLLQLHYALKQKRLS